MSMQMDTCLIKEQIGTLFVWVGAPRKVGLGGGWWVRGVQPKNWACLSKEKFQPPPGCSVRFFGSKGLIKFVEDLKPSSCLKGSICNFGKRAIGLFSIFPISCLCL
jgi:hypothetical protein